MSSLSIKGHAVKTTHIRMDVMRKEAKLKLGRLLAVLGDLLLGKVNGTEAPNILYTGSRPCLLFDKCNRPSCHREVQPGFRLGCVLAPIALLQPFPRILYGPHCRVTK